MLEVILSELLPHLPGANQLTDLKGRVFFLYSLGSTFWWLKYLKMTKSSQLICPLILWTHKGLKIHLQYILTIMWLVHAWLDNDQLYPYPSSLLHWCWNNALVPIELPWKILVNNWLESVRNWTYHHIQQDKTVYVIYIIYCIYYRDPFY